MEKLDMHLAAIDELVDDENKLVTYKYVSQHLALPISQAKRVLEQYAEANEKNMVSVVYSLVGKTSKGLHVALIRDVDLKAAKSHLDVVVSCHPYSVHKAKLKDPNPLYTADYDMTKASLFKCGSSVKYNGAQSMTDEEITEVKNSMRKVTVADSHHTSSSTVPPSKKSTQQKGISSLFAKSSKGAAASDRDTNSREVIKTTEQVLKSETNTSPIQKDKQSREDSAKQPAKKSSGMGAFMTKGKQDLFSSKSKTSPPKTKAAPPKLKKSPPKSGKVPDAVDSVEEMEIEVTDSTRDTAKPDLLDELEDEAIQQDIVSKTHTKEKRNKPKVKKPRTNSGELPAKKRRRIKEVSSSSEDDSEEEFNEDIIPPSPEPVMAKSTSVIKVGPKNARKRRVLKSHTYVDKDGSMLTEKRYEEVSCSSEDETPVTRSTEPQEGVNEPTPATSPTAVKLNVKKNKQASIMGFFSKKSKA